MSKESYVSDEDGNRTHVREVNDDGDESKLYEYDDSLISHITGNHKGECVEVATHDENGKTRAYEYDDSIISHITGDHRGEEKSEDKSGCFLTTACTEAGGLPDDCHELTVMRKFRDEYVAKMPDGAALISEYYKTAPNIVGKIHASAQRAKILTGVLRDVRETVNLVKSGECQKAVTSYQNMFLQLKHELAIN